MWTRVATERKVLGCTGTFSFHHDLIGSYWAGEPDGIEASPLHRLCTLSRKMGVRAVLVEDALARPGVAEEIAALEAMRDGGDGIVTALAFTFVSKRFQSAGTLAAGDVIGQAVLITYPLGSRPKSFVFEAVIRIPHTLSRPGKPLLDNFIPVRRDFEITVDGHPFAIEASFFCQQNGLTTVCAHSVVKCLMRDLKDARTQAAELNALWNLARPAEGVGTAQIRQAFEAAGYRVIAYDFAHNAGGRRDNATAWGLICSLIESGSPALLTFRTAGPANHVVPVIGYTLNTDEWHPNAAALYLAGDQATVSSSLWIDHLIIHDDMLGPYFCLSRAWLGEGGRHGHREMTPQQVIAILPAEVDISATVAETIAAGTLDEFVGILVQASAGRGRWWNLLAAGRHRRVLRTTLVRRNVYLAHLGEPRPGRSRNVDEADLAFLEEELPDLFWMCEVSLPQLYTGSRTKLGEILVRVGPYDDEPARNVVGLRFPSMLCLPKDGELLVTRTRSTGHVPLLAPADHGNRW